MLVTADIQEAARGVDVAVMLAGAPRRPGAERREVVAANVPIYKEQAAALEAGASRALKARPACLPHSCRCWGRWALHGIICLAGLAGRAPAACGHR